MNRKNFSKKEESTQTRPPEYIERFYRRQVKSEDLVNYQIKLKESDILVSTETNLASETKKILKKYRSQIEDYIAEDPLFAKSLKPIKVKKKASPIVKEMAEAAFLAGVGPMAGVAGAISQFLGKDLEKFSAEVIVENGGDIFIQSQKIRRIGIFSGVSSWRDSLCLEISPEETPLGICTSSGKIGPSLSLGDADAVVVLSSSAILADTVATAVGNMIYSSKDIDKGIEFGKKIKNIKGLLIVKDKHLGVWGQITLVE